MDFSSMMRQVQEMSSKFKSSQEELAAKSVEGTSGGGMVRARMNGLGDLTGLEIEKQAVNPDDVEMLADLIIAAVADAKRRSAALKIEGMKSLTGGLDLSALGIDLSSLT